MPARFVVSQDGIIRKVDVDPDYTRRPEPEDTIEFLTQLP
jgi:peroxiredoxin